MKVTKTDDYNTIYIEWSLMRNTAGYEVQGEEGSEIESKDASLALR